jgi:chemotaxis protein methyltransferase CheR
MLRVDTGITEELEIDLLLEGLFRQYGFDFREYARSSLRRRIRAAVTAEALTTVSSLQDRMLHDPACLERLLLALSVQVSAMFRDPRFFLTFRRQAVPFLRTYPFIRIWQAGCSTGEEVYSLAILLQEEGLYDRCRIYATDMNESVLQRAREGIYSLELMQRYTANYLASGGTAEFSSYYTAAYEHVIFRPSLRERVVFSQHNLASDGPFNEFNVILCRNVMIYFNNSLQDRVHRLFYQSLARLGVLGLGQRESLRFSPHEASYEMVDAAQCLFRKVE